MPRKSTSMQAAVAATELNAKIKRDIEAEAAPKTLLYTLVFGECEHTGDIEDMLDFIADPSRSSIADEDERKLPGVRFTTIKDTAPVGYEQGVALVEISSSDKEAFCALARRCGFLESMEAGDHFEGTCDRLDYEHEAECDDDDRDGYSDDGDCY